MWRDESLKMSFSIQKPYDYRFFYILWLILEVA